MTDRVTRTEQSRLHRAIEAIVEDVAQRERLTLSQALDRVAADLESRVARST